MEITRRALLAGLAALALVGCSSGGGPTDAARAADPDWHTVVVEGASFEVPAGVELDESRTHSSTNGTNDYLLEGDDLTVWVTTQSPYSVTGSYATVDAGGETAYVDDGDTMRTVYVNHGDRGYCFLCMTQADGDPEVVTEAMDRLLSTLSFG